MKKRISDEIPVEEIDKWKKGSIITISAGTDSGKSYFVKHVLSKYLQDHWGGKILLLIHRARVKEQFIEELKNIDNVEVRTYQSIERDLGDYAGITPDDYPSYLNSYAYIVCDEYHYFTNDSNVNNYTDMSFNAIIDSTPSIIFMSATGDCMVQVLKDALKLKGKRINFKYRIPDLHENIRSLTFFNDTNDIVDLMNFWKNDKGKAIIFVNNISVGRMLYEIFRSDSVFLCSQQRLEYKELVDEKKIQSIINNKKFNEKYLITTSVLDSGADIIDREVIRIVCDIKDYNVLIQCLGRKRMINENDKVDVYIKNISNKSLEKTNENLVKSLAYADMLINFDESKYVATIARRNDKYVYFIVEDGKTIPKLNKMRYAYAKFMIKTINDILKIKVKKQNYAMFIKRKLHFRRRYGWIDVKHEQQIKTLVNYLQEHCGTIYYKVQDRDPLIQAIGLLGTNRHLVRDLDTLNAYLKSEQIPYKILLQVARKPGVKNPFRSAWKITVAPENIKNTKK